MYSRTYLYILGYVLKIEALFMVPSVGIALYNKENSSVTAFLISIAVLLAIGVPLSWKRPEKTVLYAKQGLQIAAISWLALSVFGALPFFLSGAIPSFLDCLFETVSGFTTTGASILTNVEAMARGLLFWRSFTHWIGGMGVLIFLLVIIPLSGGYSLNLMKAESPGPIKSKLVPKLKQSATILYVIYIVMTLIEVLLLYLGGMPLFDSFTHAFGTAGTGGFSIKNASIGYYNNAYFEYVIGIFMILFGINFYAYFLILVRKFKELLHFEEPRYYLLIIFAAVALITVNTVGSIHTSLSDAFRYAFFQVASIITTTGFVTHDFNLWPQFSRVILLALMVCGACAGSTGGGIKVSRAVLAAKSIKREFRRLIHPHSVEIVRLDRKPVRDETISQISVFLILYTAITVVSVLIVALDAFDFDTTFSSVLACLNNIGPGLGIVGPIGNYSGFGALSKIILTVDMLFGRLEIFPLLALFLPGMWRNRAKTAV
jgi:trk system potassium uptake protein TrkH